MANEQKMAFGSVTTVISLTASLANNNVAGGTTELDNSNLYPMGLATFNNPDGFGAAPNDLSTVGLYMVRNETDGASNDDSSNPSGTDVEAAEHVGNFIIYDTNEEQRNTIVISLLGVKKADFYIGNKVGQTITYSSGPITVKITPFTIGT